jgi:hypothetical protein
MTMTPEERFDRIEMAIIGLTEINKTCIASVQNLATAVDAFRRTVEKDHANAEAEMKNLREAQSETDAKINILIATVDRIIRFKGGPS